MLNNFYDNSNIIFNKEIKFFIENKNKNLKHDQFIQNLFKNYQKNNFLNETVIQIINNFLNQDEVYKNLTKEVIEYLDICFKYDFKMKLNKILLFLLSISFLNEFDYKQIKEINLFYKYKHKYKYQYKKESKKNKKTKNIKTVNDLINYIKFKINKLSVKDLHSISKISNLFDKKNSLIYDLKLFFDIFEIKHLF